MLEPDENINGDLINKAKPDAMQANASARTAIPGSAGVEQHRSIIHANEKDDIWSSPWASLMMVLFAILFMMISQQQDENTSTPATVQQAVILTQDSKPTDHSAEDLGIDEATLVLMPALLTEIKQYVSAMNTDKIKASMQIDYSIKISLAASILFDSDSIELSQQARRFLDKLSISLKKNRQQLHVIGHTDDQAVDLEQYTDKWQLSLLRASTVTHYLITQGQVEPYKFTIMGRSEYEPLVANLNDKARTMNRRVDIVITNNQSRAMENRL